MTVTTRKKWYDHKLNAFANWDEPWPPLKYRPNVTGWQRKIAWWLRNPLHNFMFHWIGVAGRVKRFEGEFLTSGWQLAWVHTRWLKLPLISYKGDAIEFYIGWRKNGGFGIALRKADAKEASHVA